MSAAAALSADGHAAPNSQGLRRLDGMNGPITLTAELAGWKGSVDRSLDGCEGVAALLYGFTWGLDHCARQRSVSSFSLKASGVS